MDLNEWQGPPHRVKIWKFITRIQKLQSTTISQSMHIPIFPLKNTTLPVLDTHLSTHVLRMQVMLVSSKY